MARIIPTLLAILSLTLCAWGDQQTAESLQKQLPKFSCSGTLEKVLTNIAQQGTFKIQIDWPALAAAGVTKDAQITVQAPNAKIGQLIDLALSKAEIKDKPLAWYQSGKIVQVSTQARVLERPNEPRLDALAAAPAAKPAPTGRDLDFKNVPLSEVLGFIRTWSEVNMDINWKSLEPSGIAADLAITLQAKGVSPGRALDLVLAQANGNKGKFERAYWVLSDGVVTIASGSALNNDIIVHVYDVRDLLMVIPDFEGPRLASSGNVASSDSKGGKSASIWQDSGSNSSQARTGPDLAEQREQVRKKLLSAVRDSIGEDMWQPDGKGSIRILNGKMVISQTLLGYKLLENAGRRK